MNLRFYPPGAAANTDEGFRMYKFINWQGRTITMTDLQLQNELEHATSIIDGINRSNNNSAKSNHHYDGRTEKEWHSRRIFLLDLRENPLSPDEFARAVADEEMYDKLHEETSYLQSIESARRTDRAMWVFGGLLAAFGLYMFFSSFGSD